jgi:hypothetical protein
MLCRVCVCMLRGGTGQQWNGTHDLTFSHHSRTESLRRSREAGCSICIALANELRSEIDLLEDQSISIEASLSVLEFRKDRKAEVKGSRLDVSLYRLEFLLQKRRNRTFVLNQVGEFHFHPKIIEQICGEESMIKISKAGLNHHKSCYSRS